MTKVARIMAMHKRGKTTKEIAIEVYGKASESATAYVRVVTRQRKGTAYSPADTKYLTKRYGGTTGSEAWRNRYWNDPEFRERRKAYALRDYHKRKQLLKAA